MSEWNVGISLLCKCPPLGVIERVHSTLVRLLRRLLRRVLLPRLFDAKLDYLFNQIERDRLVQRELNRTFCALKTGQFPSESLDPRRGGIEPNVLLEARKVHKVFVQNKCWHPIFKGFLRIRCSLPDGSPYLLEQFLNIWW